MFDVATLLDCFRNWVGFNQPASNCNIDFLERITTTESGSFFQDFHTVLTTENLYQIAPNFDRYNVSDWATYNEFDNATTYNQGDVVTTYNNQVLYKSLVNSNLGNTPPESFSSDSFWQFVKYKPTFENWLFQIREKAIRDVFRKIITNKKLKKATKTLFQNQHIFKSVSRPLSYEQIENDSEGLPNYKFVGWRLKLSSYENLRLLIHQIGLKFTGVNNFNLYLFVASRKEPIAQVTVNTNDATVNFQWEKLSNWEIRYYSDEYDRGDVFYLGYFQDELAGQAINEHGQFYGCGCGHESWFNNNYWVSKSRRKWFDLQPVYIDNVNLNGRLLPNIGLSEENVKRAYNKTFGLNLLLSLRCDLTDFFCRNKDLFTDLIGYQLAVNMLNEDINTSDSMSGQQLQLSEYTQKELAKLDINVPSLYKTYSELLQNIDFDLSDLKSPCLTCGKQGIRFTSVTNLN